jgi:hypothetical protein
MHTDLKCYHLQIALSFYPDLCICVLFVLRISQTVYASLKDTCIRGLSGSAQPFGDDETLKRCVDVESKCQKISLCMQWDLQFVWSIRKWRNAANNTFGELKKVSLSRQNQCLMDGLPMSVPNKRHWWNLSSGASNIFLSIAFRLTLIFSSSMFGTKACIRLISCSGLPLPAKHHPSCACDKAAVGSWLL